MEKKRSKGLTVLGYYFMLAGAFRFIIIVYKSFWNEFYQTHSEYNHIIAKLQLLFGFTTP